MKLGLNDQVKKNIDKVEHVFLYDDDDSSTLMWCCLNDPNNSGANIKRETGMLTGISHTAQVSIYEMPNGKFCAVCYPCSVRVNYDKFSTAMHKLFSHVDRRYWDSNAYSHFLFCLKNGYDSLLKEKPRR